MRGSRSSPPQPPPPNPPPLARPEERGRKIPRLASVRGTTGWGVEIDAYGVIFAQRRPVSVEVASGRIRKKDASYSVVHPEGQGFRGQAEIKLAPGAQLAVDDLWQVQGESVRVERRTWVTGRAPGGFLTSLTLGRRASPARWAKVEPFIPGVAYGRSEPVPRWSIGSPEGRRRGVRSIIAREDRMAAPLFAARFPDGHWLAVLHLQPNGDTVAAESLDVRGEVLIDERFSFASLGAVSRDGLLEVGAWFPGTEGEVTYSVGVLPERQYHRWRRRYHPMTEGMEQAYELAFHFGSGQDPMQFYRTTWRAAWDACQPTWAPVDPDAVVCACSAVLASQVVRVGEKAGIPLEADPTTGRPPSTQTGAIMGFVGANTDAAYVLLRVGEEAEPPTAHRYQALAVTILDSFASIGLNPPLAEGFDLRTGRLTTYRRLRGRPSVYARSIAEGCLATLEAWRFEKDRQRNHPQWLEWCQAGGAWLLKSQGADGRLPRAWQAGSGRVIDASMSASYIVVPFLVRLARETGERQYLEAAQRAGEFTWRRGGSSGCFAGATIDKSAVVDKEAAVIALEGYLDLYDATADRKWLVRALTAATMAETWMYLWDVPMPIDADDASLHWKRGASTVGLQLIATGSSMADGFLAINASAFARLYAATGDSHFLDVARIVTHGTKSMLALPGRTYDLAGPGWQQEHWGLSLLRGRGLNRNWLPWTSVAQAKGILRLRDLGSHLADLVLLSGRP